MTVNARIARFCEYRGIKKKELCDWGLGTAQTINDMLKGRKKPGHEFIMFLLEKFPELNIRWLLLGEGEMIAEVYLNNEKEPDELYRKKLIKKLEEDRVYLKKLLKKVKDENKGLNNDIK